MTPYGGCRFGSLTRNCSIQKSPTSIIFLPALLPDQSPRLCFSSALWRRQSLGLISTCSAGCHRPNPAARKGARCKRRGSSSSFSNGGIGVELHLPPCDMYHSRGRDMASQSAERVRKRRDALRRAGLRSVQILVPDTSDAAFVAECHRQALALRNDSHQAEILDWIERAADRSGWE